MSFEKFGGLFYVNHFKYVFLYSVLLLVIFIFLIREKI